MTDTDRLARNQRIADAMGIRGGVPYFGTDPFAADWLMRWLRDEKYLVQIDPVADMPGRGHCVTIMRSDTVGTALAQVTHHDWTVALALAADAAIKEAERV